MTIIPDCPSCKHFIKINDEGRFFCEAFPNGIPKEYVWGKTSVIHLKECANNIRFEDIEQFLNRP